MKIVYLTAGAAGMYCGSCMHDNTLSKAMSREGADVQLVPTYTPIRTDEDDFSVDLVFFGGINVYLQQKVPLLRFLPKLFDRFLDSPWLIKKVTRNASKVAPKELGKLAYSMLRGSQGHQKKEVQRLAHWLKKTAQPDVVVFSNALIGGCIPTLQQELGVDCFVTLQGDDIFLDSLPAKYKKLCINEIRKLHSSVKRYVAHSDFYADFMSEYFSIERKQIAVTPLGIETEDFSRAEFSENRPPTIGYLARIAPEKGLDVLVDAFIRLSQSGLVPDVKLKIAGWLGPTHEDYAQKQFEKIHRAGLENDFEYVGSIERGSKIDFLRSLDVFSVPTSYREPKGLFVLEALATGVPVVQPDHGAFPEVIQSTGGGLLFPAGDTGALVDELGRLLNDHVLRNELANQGFQSVHATRNSREMAKLTLDVLRWQPG